MSGPVIAATATRIAAFSPLLFWPGVVGQFMKYMPITLIATLSASLVVALFFTPTLGALLGRAAAVPHDERTSDRGPYMRTVRLALRHPGLTLGLAVLLLFAVQTDLWQVRPRGRVLPQRRARLRPGHRACAAAIFRSTRRTARSARSKSACSTFDGLKTVYSRIGEQPRGMSDITEDTIGVIQFEFADWRDAAAGP